MGVAMRGDDEIYGNLFSYIDVEDRVRRDHPLRVIREIANTALAALTGEFAALYCGMGRPSVPPEKLLRAMLLQAFYSVRSERQLMERIEFDLLFRWFVGIGIDDPVSADCVEKLFEYRGIILGLSQVAIAGGQSMMGDRQVQQNTLFYEFSLERHVPETHLLRAIDRFVELDGVRVYLAPFYSETGRPSIDPELLIRMLIVGYCFGIRSERRLCEEVHLNLAYRWFL